MEARLSARMRGGSGGSCAPTHPPQAAMEALFGRAEAAVDGGRADGDATEVVEDGEEDGGAPASDA